jgi:hypothetical protein
MGRLRARGRAARVVLRADVRRCWPAWLLLGVFGGLLVGAVVVCAAGARRTSDAFDRFARSAHAADLTIEVEHAGSFLAGADIPGVEARGADFVLGQAGFIVVDGHVVPAPRNAKVLATSGAYLDGLDRLRVVEGRLPQPGAAEGLATGTWLQQMGLHVGDTVVYRVPDLEDESDEQFSSEAELRAALEADPTIGSTVPITVVGRGVHIADIARDEAAQSARLVVDRDTGARLLQAPPDILFTDATQVLMTFSPQVDPAEVIAAMEAPPYRGLNPQLLTTLRDDVATATQPAVLALWISAALATIASLGVLGAALARQAVSDAAGHGRLRALGMDRADLRLLVVLRASVISATTIGVTAIVMIVGSLLFPIGPTAVVRERAVSVDLPVLLTAALAVVVGAAVVSVVAVATIDRRSLPTAVRERSVVLASALPLPVRLGIHFTTPPRGPVRFVMRSAAVAAAVAVTAGVAVVLFTASLDDLVQHPGRHGWNWDVAATCNEGYCDIPPDAVAAVGAKVAKEPTIEAWTFATFGTIRVGTEPVPFIAASPSVGDLEPFTITRGRAPVEADEVALGAATLRRLGRTIGERVDVDVDVDDGRSSVTIVGEAVFTGVGKFDTQRASLGTGAALTSAGVDRLFGDRDDPDFFLARVEPGGRERIQQMFPGFVLIDARAPGGLAVWPSLRILTVIVAGALALLALGSVLHARALSRRLRARDLAVLRALGLGRRQLTGALRWQALTLLAIALVVGVPIGALVGARSWWFVADRMDLASPIHVVSPQLAVAGVVLFLVAVALVVVVRRPTTDPATLRAD